MAVRSTYNERYSFPDPSGTESACRSTRYRAKKRAREQQELEQEEEQQELELEEEQLSSDASHPFTTGPLIEACDVPTEYSEMDNPEVLESELLGFESTDEDEEPVDCYSTAANADPLYDGASLTVSSSNILIMQYKMRHSLTDQALTDLLHLLRLHCPTPNHCAPSIYHFKKHFQGMKYPVTFHYYCSSCLEGVGDSDLFCSNQLCGGALKASGARSSFIEVPIEAQLQTLFQSKYMPLAAWCMCEIVSVIYQLYMDIVFYYI